MSDTKIVCELKATLTGMSTHLRGDTPIHQKVHTEHGWRSLFPIDALLIDVWTEPDDFRPRLATTADKMAGRLESGETPDADCLADLAILLLALDGVHLSTILDRRVQDKHSQEGVRLWHEDLLARYGSSIAKPWGIATSQHSGTRIWIDAKTVPAEEWFRPWTSTTGASAPTTHIVSRT